MPPSDRYRPSRAIEMLGDAFYDTVEAARFPRLTLRFRNQRHAETVGLGSLTDTEWAAHFARFEALPEGLAAPLALRYHGHQFGVYNPRLGDGRGFLFAQLYDGDGRLLDLGTKGSGQTPWSRGGDGRLTLKGGVREVLATELLEALGVNTSKSFSLFETGESLHRHDEPSPTRASVLVRLSHSHVRFGSFQRHAHAGDTASLTKLLDYAIEHFDPTVDEREGADRAAKFVGGVCERTAQTAAAWMAAGFVHGVLNTDNMNVTGESFDYGPWRFLPKYDPNFVAAYFDETALYAYGRQPSRLRWNLFRLAEALLPLSAVSSMERVLTLYDSAFARAMGDHLTRRLGLRSKGFDEDQRLLDATVRFWETTPGGFERFFFDNHGNVAVRREASPEKARYALPAFAPLRAVLDGYEPVANLAHDHPYFAGEGPCTLLIDELEAIWAPIAAADDWSAFDAKITAIRAMGEALKTRG